MGERALLFLHRCLFFVWLGVWSMNLAHASEPASTDMVRGTVDAVNYEPANLQVEVHGWVWDALTSQPVTQLLINIRGERFSIENPTLVTRGDVQQALNIPLANTGFSAILSLSAALPSGIHPVEITAFFEDGRSHLVKTGIGTEPTISSDMPPPRHWILLALVLACIAFAYLPSLHDRFKDIGQWVQGHPGIISVCIWASFALLVALGITGSSWQLLTKGSDSQFVEFKGSSSNIFKPRQIRSDEWSILTANALAQWNHAPQFPVVNTNLGLEGQNMGVIGMTGVPVAQLAALARPATWGYFFLPLRQAMSWHWQFAFFACLFFLWKSLNLLNPKRSGLHLLLAFSFCVAPYAVGWSLWPLYATFFPLALFVFSAEALKKQKKISALTIGFVLGLLFAGWVLVLYPPWQITVGSFLVLFFVGWIADQRKILQFHKGQLYCVLTGALVASIILASWWHDTAAAVAQMQATAYPGGRVVQQGGDLDFFWLLRGYTNLENLSFSVAPVLNQSEVSSFLLFPIPILLFSAWLLFQSPRKNWALWACMGFMAFWLVFRFIGIPYWLSKITLWSYVTPTRLDLVLGLVMTFIMAIICRKIESPVNGGNKNRFTWFVALLVAIVSAWTVFLEFSVMPRGLIRVYSNVYLIALMLAVGFGSWWIMRGRLVAAISMTLFLSIVATFSFNPLSLAPRKVTLAQASENFVSSEMQKMPRLRTLVFSEDSKAPMTLAAAGVPVVNGVLYYPHRELWERIKLLKENWYDVNRYQHLLFSIDNLPNENSFKVAHPSLDIVKVTIDPRKFDFSSTGAQRIAARESSAIKLRISPQLEELGNYGGLTWFAVRPSEFAVEN
ncbi:DUF7657 domain-containing protein [Comamonas sp.]|uniref:DUF7657 domain-containing protein n=2 Tax=Comamonas sp. TaxID=34028 RepID=UPI002FC7F1AB